MEAFNRLASRPPTNAAAKSDLESLSRQLHDRLWKPNQAGIAAASTLLVAGENPIAGLPFECLQDSDSYLGQHYRFRRLRKLTLREPKAAAPGPNILPGRRLVYAPLGKTQGDLALNSAISEAKRIPKLMPGFKFETHVGLDATTAQYRHDTKKPFSLLHIATHGIPDRVSGSTGLALWREPGATGGAPDEVDLLSVTEILGSKLQGRLAVLAACDSSGGAASTSLADAYLTAGVREVIAARWKVVTWQPPSSCGSFIPALAKAAALRVRYEAPVPT